MSIDRPDLSDAFSSPRRVPIDRAATLTGLLPATRPRPAPVEQPAAVVPAEEGPAVLAVSTAPRRTGPARTPRAAPAAPAPVSDSAYTVTNVAVYLEPDLLEQTKIARRTTGSTYDDLVVQAFASVDDAELQRHFQVNVPVIELTGMPARQRRPRGTAGIQIQLRLSGTQTAWLNEKQQRLGAPSRSALVAAALRLHLLR